MKRAGSAAASALLGLFLSASPALAAPVIGSTPRAAALAMTRQYAAHEIHVHPNYPGLASTTGNCKLLFRTPWAAWGCAYQIDGWGRNRECVVLKLALKHLAGPRYQATVKGLVRVTWAQKCPPWP